MEEKAINKATSDKINSDTYTDAETKLYEKDWAETYKSLLYELKLQI